MVATLLTWVQFRNNWTVDGEVATDEQYDVLDALAAEIIGAITDGECMNELANALIEAAEILAARRCCDSGGTVVYGDGIPDPGPGFVPGADGRWTPEEVAQLMDLVPGSFTDDGENFPDGFVTRSEYLDAKCVIANRFYDDLTDSLQAFVAIDTIGVVLGGALLGQVIVGAGTGGALVTGLVAVGLSAPLAIAALVVILVGLLAAGVAVGFALEQIAQRMDREAVVCALVAATDYQEARNELNALVEGALAQAVADGALESADIFEGQLLELIAILAPDEVLEALFAGAALVNDIYNADEGDFDCSLCNVPDPGEQLLIDPQFNDPASEGTVYIFTGNATFSGGSARPSSGFGPFEVYQQISGIPAGVAVTAVLRVRRHPIETGQVRLWWAYESGGVWSPEQDLVSGNNNGADYRTLATSFVTNGSPLRIHGFGWEFTEMTLTVDTE